MIFKKKKKINNIIFWSNYAIFRQNLTNSSNSVVYYINYYLILILYQT
jgi:hypothetical protein